MREPPKEPTKSVSSSSSPFLSSELVCMSLTFLLLHSLVSPSPLFFDQRTARTLLSSSLTVEHIHAQLVLSAHTSLMFYPHLLPLPPSRSLVFTFFLSQYITTYTCACKNTQSSVFPPLPPFSIPNSHKSTRAQLFPLPSTPSPLPPSFPLSSPPSSHTTPSPPSRTPAAP